MADLPRCAALLLILALAAACGRAPVPPPYVPLDPAAFDGEKALFEVHALVVRGPRDAGGPGAEQAAKHLAARLQALGVETRVDVFTNATPQGPRVFRNVIGRVPGDSRLILVGSHYDTKTGLGPAFQGANDSGSSSGVLLELARVLSQRGPAGPEIELVFFDGEEAAVSYSENDGLHGSRHHAEALVRSGRYRQVLAVLVLDMIGDRDLTVMLPRNGTPALASTVLQAAHEDGSRLHFSLFPYEVGDDHEPFLRRGMPAIDLIDFEYGSAPGRNDYWHTAQDTLDKLSADSLGIMGRVTLRAINNLSASAEAKAVR